MKLPFARSLVLGLLPSLLAIACSSGNDGAAGNDGASTPEGEAVATEDEIRASCSNPRRYFATFREGGGVCDPIAAHRGQWLPEPLFADAPADVQSSTCAYRWSGDKYSRPDRDAIAAKVGYANALAASCGPSAEPTVGLLQPIPGVDVVKSVGSVGCDVCGVLRNGRMWVVLPPEKVALRQFQVALDNGQQRAFQIQPTEARALSITLPPPPAGTRYTSGRVAIF